MYYNTFDLIVSDIMMPGIDGYESAKTVRGLDENIPILFMTARDEFASKQQGYRIGVDDYMIKPIDLDELLLRIGALLRRAKIANSHRLDQSVTKPGTIVSIIVGILSALFFGIGMCCTMVWEGLMIPGIIIGIIGIIGIVAAYPLFIHITKKQREKVAPEIIRLTDELMK